jgi:hypothetical protein
LQGKKLEGGREGRKEGRKEGRQAGRKVGRQEGKKEENLRMRSGEDMSAVVGIPCAFLHHELKVRRDHTLLSYLVFVLFYFILCAFDLSALL